MAALFEDEINKFVKSDLSKALNQPEQNNFLAKSHMWKFIADIDIGDAIERLRMELQKDKQPGSYYHAWQCNIAMCFYDAYKHHHNDGQMYGMHKIHEIANIAAEKFLEILCLQTETNIGLIKQSELQNLPPKSPDDPAY